MKSNLTWRVAAGMYGDCYETLRGPILIAGETSGLPTIRPETHQIPFTRLCNQDPKLTLRSHVKYPIIPEWKPTEYPPEHRF